MVVAAPVFDKSDPKVKETISFHLPMGNEDWGKSKDLFGSSLMMLAGGGMFTRNPMIIWTSVVLAVQQFVTQEPLRRSEDSTSPLASLGMAASGVLATTMPKILLAAEPAAAASAVTTVAEAAAQAAAT